MHRSAIRGRPLPERTDFRLTNLPFDCILLQPGQLTIGDELLQQQQQQQQQQHQRLPDFILIERGRLSKKKKKKNMMMMMMMMIIINIGSVGLPH